MSLAFFGEPRMPRLSKLLDEIKKGEILIPRFQRPFIWTDQQRLDLVASVYQGYPMGAILVWRTQKHNLATYENLGPLRLPQAEDPNVTRQYLLDGHQRMATLFAALGPALYDENEAPTWSNDPEECDRWPIYFDLESTDNEPFRLSSAGTKPKLTWLPLDILLDPYELNDFALKLQQAYHDRRMVNRVHSIAEKFRDYQIPVMPIATEDITQVTVSFKRVNTGGSRMSEVHMIHALGHGHNFDLLKELESLSESLKPIGWEHFDEQLTLNICKSRLDVDIYRTDTEVTAKLLAEKPNIFDETREIIVRVAALLDRIAHVKSPKSLPYGYQAVLLADALREVDDVSEELAENLRKWFWATTLAEYFRGMTNSLFENAREHLRNVVVGKADFLPPGIRKDILPIRRFDYRHARCRGIALLLAEQNPVTLDESPPRSADGFALLGLYGADALSKLAKEGELDEQYRSMANGPQNRFIIHPKNSRSLRRLLDLSLSGDAPILASHAIDFEGFEDPDIKNLNHLLGVRQSRIEELEMTRAERCGLGWVSSINLTDDY